MYGRQKINDAYILLENNLKSPFISFKHHVVSYAMDKKHTNIKSLYIYRGYLREAKAIVKNGYLEITFHSSKLAEKWDAAEENVQDIAWLFRDFTRQWKSVHTDYSYMRVYQKI